MSKRYTTWTNQETGITYTDEHDGDGGGCLLVSLMLIGFVVLMALQGIYIATGVNLLDFLGGGS